ncbi:MAG: RNA polymerase factor sigma-54 [Planctomycetia bacterium]
MRPAAPALRQSQGLRQELLLLPQMLQSLEMLALPAQELCEWLERQAESNEALDVRRPQPNLRQEGGSSDWVAEQAASAPTLVEHIESELALSELAPERGLTVRWLATRLDARGWLVESEEELCQAGALAGLWKADDALSLRQAVAALQQLEPRGLGARDLCEALLLQLDPQDPDYSMLARLIELHLEDLAARRLHRIACALSITGAALEALRARLRVLDPFPGTRFTAPVAAILPEVLVEWNSDGTYEVRLDTRQWPAARVDPAVEELARSQGRTSELARYLRPKIEAARSIRNALIQRQRTLARVAAALFARQSRFLREGPQALIPLAMHELAAELELSVSTISRTVQGKHAQTPHGIFPLRSFFPVAGSDDSGATRSAIAQAVRALYAAEDPQHPFSDAEALERLARSGHRMARRTLAKHRSELGIPSRYARRVLR